MNIYKINCKRLSLWLFIITQVTLIMIYYYIERNGAEYYSGKVSFFKARYLQLKTNRTYHAEGDIIKLPKYKVKDKFLDFNSSLCFENGTDLNSMKRLKNSWACKCKTGWHGTECGQPEVIWRALLKYRKKLDIKGPLSFAKRMLYIFKVDEFSETLIDIRINELYEVIDLFILIDEGNGIEKLLNNNFLKKYSKKILYLKNLPLKDIWSLITLSIPDLENNDMVLVSKSFEIPNKFALGFLKYYDNWPEPILFRLRWSVFGFFWKHPSKTQTQGIACSVGYIKKAFDSKFEDFYLSTKISGLVLGDLNHYGGWYCEYCMDPMQIIKFIAANSDKNLVNQILLNQEKIDVNYIEELIENGLYIDGKTELERSRKYQDNYFAPSYVSENSVKFDYLLLNLYTKLDYYEG